jgi:hypothetical protein
VWQDQPITTARGLLAGELQLYWPRPLVGWLRDRSFGLALDWVFRVTAVLIPRTGSPHAAELLAELNQLQRWRAAPPPSGVFRQKAEDLWYSPNRDGACTAMSHLCWSLAEVVCPDLEIGVNWLWRVPLLLCDNDFQGKPRTELVEWCLSDFEMFAAAVVQQHPFPKALREGTAE